MVRNPEKKMTRKIRKNRQTRKTNLRRIRTKMWRNRTYKTMKGGERWMLVNLRRELKPSESTKSRLNIGKELNNHMIKLKNKFLEFRPFTPVRTPHSSRPDKYGDEFMTQLKTVSKWFNSKNDSFIPEQVVPKLDDSFVIAFMKIYVRYYDVAKKDPIILPPDRFEAILTKVLTGDIHTSVVGARVRSLNDDEYKKLSSSLYHMIGCLNQSLHGWGRQVAQHEISQEQSSSSSVSKQQTTKDYELTAAVPPSLQNFCQTLDKMFSISTSTAVVRMCCFITMPNAVYKGDPNKRRFVEGYDSESFDTELRQWEWIPTENLARNTYFETRKELRKIYQKNNQPNDKNPHRELVVLDERSVTLLTYTMSPYISNQEKKDKTYSINIQTQIRHEDLLNSMDDIIKKATESFKTTMGYKKQKFETTGSIVFVRKATTTKLMTYYELKISKQQISSNDVIVCSLKAISEDGICGSEAIFVTYSPPPPPPPLPGQPQGLEELDVADDPNKVDTLKKDIIDQIFIPERRRLERVLTTEASTYISKIDVELDSASITGHIQQEVQITTRGGYAESPNSTGPNISTGPVILGEKEEYNGICTLVLTFDIRYKAAWVVAKATPIQTAAFKAVNKYITGPTNRWTPQNVKLFCVSNNAEDDSNITVSVEVKEVDKDKKLLSAEYQAKASSPYELYQSKKAAIEAITDKKFNYFWTDQV